MGDDRPLWIQSWLNYHKGKEVEKELPMHSHKENYHGYISISPQDTSTIFRNGLKIDNKIGLVTTQKENTKQFKKGLLQQMFV